MTTYNVINTESPFSAVESTPAAEGNLTFFYVSNAGKLEDAKNRLNKLGQAIVSETPTDGNIVLVTRGNTTKEELVQALKDTGNTLAEEEAKHKINWWSFRGNMSNAGQGLQLVSALKEPKPSEKNNFTKPKYAADQGMFAILNLAANFVNIIFGGQKEKDHHRLLYIKENQNKLLADDVKSKLPDINEKHAPMRKEPAPPPTLGQRFYAFMRKNSVVFGEIGLRYMGSLALVFPVKPAHWKKVGAAYKEGGIRAALPATLNRSDNYNLASGITYLVGKSLAFFSKVPDPYNPKPPGTLERIREKYVFRTASAIETGAAGVLAVGNFKKGKPLGGIGGTLFMGGLTTRFWAPFGSREVNTEEVFAYTSDLLADAPREKLPQLVAASAAQLAEDLSDHQKLTFGSIYTRLTMDLYQYHNIAIDHPVMESDEIPKDKEIPPKDTVHTKRGNKKEEREETAQDAPPFTNSSSNMLGATAPESKNFAEKVSRLDTNAAQSL